MSELQSQQGNSEPEPRPSPGMVFECMYNRAIYAQPCDRCDGTCKVLTEGARVNASGREDSR